MTTEDLRPLLNDAHTTNLFFRVGEKTFWRRSATVCRSDGATRSHDSIGKPDGGFLGIVAGDVIRRLVATAVGRSCRGFHSTLPVCALNQSGM